MARGVLLTDARCTGVNKGVAFRAKLKKLKKLKPGWHNFTVRAIDPNNNKSGQTSFRWKVKKKPKKG